MDNNILELKKKKYKIELLHENYPQTEAFLNIILLGDSGVGKSCIFNKAMKDEFIEQESESVDFSSYNIKINNYFTKIQDTCGQEIYKSLTSNYYKNISLAILIYAINNKESFINIKTWLEELRSKSRRDIKIILVGNKADLEDERQVSKEEGEKFKEDNQLDLFIETSAKSGINTKNLFVEASILLFGEFGEEIKENNPNANITLCKDKETISCKSVKKEKNKCF